MSFLGYDKVLPMNTGVSGGNRHQVLSQVAYEVKRYSGNEAVIICVRP